MIGNAVTFWGSQWTAANALSGGAAPASFEGFADGSVPAPPTCGGTWISRTGNSSSPPSTVPGTMAVIVSSSIQKQGSTIYGDIRQIVLVQTDNGYAPNPGHDGTGRVVGVVCSSAPSAGATSQLDTTAGTPAPSFIEGVLSFLSGLTHGWLGGTNTA